MSFDPGESLESLFARERDRLLRLWRVRLPRDLRHRLPPERFLAKLRSLAVEEWSRSRPGPGSPTFLWLRSLALRRIAALERFQPSGRDRRAAGARSRPRARNPSGHLVASAAEVALRVFGVKGRGAASRARSLRLLSAALGALENLEREVLIRRCLEFLSNAEAAEELGLEESEVSRAYVGALKTVRRFLGVSSERERP